MATRSVLVLLVVLGLTACLPCVPVRYRVQAGDLRGRAVLQNDVPVIVDGREILVPVERVYSPAEATGERRWSDRLIQELAETHPEAEITLVSRQERCVPGSLTLAAGALATGGLALAAPGSGGTVSPMPIAESTPPVRGSSRYRRSATLGWRISSRARLPKSYIATTWASLPRCSAVATGLPSVTEAIRPRAAISAGAGST